MSKGRKTALIAGLGLLAVLAAGGLYRKDLLFRYHLYLLEKDPAYLTEIAETPAGSPEGRAVEAFVATEGGAGAVIASLIRRTTEAYDLGGRNGPRIPVDPFECMKGTGIGAIGLARREGNLGLFWDFGALEGWSRQTMEEGDPVWKLLYRIPKCEIRLPEHPSTGLSVLTAEEAGRLFPSGTFFTHEFEPGTRLCIFRSDAPAKDAAPPAPDPQQRPAAPIGTRRL